MKIENLTKEYDNHLVFSDISFDMEKNDRIGLVGPNGVGKSTLLNILRGEIIPDSGTILCEHDEIIGYLPQTGIVEYDMSVINFIRSDIFISGPLQNVSEIPEHVIDETLDIFNLQGKKLKKVSELSQGEQTKVVIAKLMIWKPNILLLDEPTNNLDIKSVLWLQGFLMTYAGNIILVSHDEFFLDSICNKLLVIDWNFRTAELISGTYKDYRDIKLHTMKNKTVAFEHQQTDLKRIERRISNLKLNSTKGVNFAGTDNDKMLRGFKRDKSKGSGEKAKSMQNKMEKTPKIVKPKFRGVIDIHIDVDKKQGLLRFDDVVGGYDGFMVKIPYLEIPYSARVLIVGPNGAGKTTLLKIIAGAIPVTGERYCEKNIIFGNFTQNHESLVGEIVVMDLFLREFPEMTTRNIVGILETFQFNVNDIYKSMDSLSSGQKARLMLAQFKLRMVNVILLDEPTNHLDIDAQDALKIFLSNYLGTLIVVSHDRNLIESIEIDTILTIENGIVIKSEQSGYEYVQLMTKE